MGNTRLGKTYSNIFYVVLFVSRNKDNKGIIEGFKERRELYMVCEDDLRRLLATFDEFVSKGKSGELCRCYVSVNKRDGGKLHKRVLHWLLDHPDYPMPALSHKIAGMALEKDCSAENHWLVDFDSTDEKVLYEFVKDLTKYIKKEDISSVSRTVHGYAIVLAHGFDTREILEKYGDFVTFKRDDMLLVKWRQKTWC